MRSSAFVASIVETWREKDSHEKVKLLAHDLRNGKQWQHINLLGEYDFSDDKLQDTVGIKPPKLAN